MNRTNPQCFQRFFQRCRPQCFKYILVFGILCVLDGLVRCGSCVNEVWYQYDKNFFEVLYCKNGQIKNVQSVEHQMMNSSHWHYRSIRISTWKEPDFQTHIYTTLDGQSEQIVSQYQSIIWFFMFAIQTIRQKILETIE